MTSIRGDTEDPFSRGHLCPKGAALGDLHADPDRLREPLRRTPRGWERLSWDEAFDAAAAGLAAVRAEHGHDAVAFYAGNPSVHDHGALFFLPVLLRALGTKSRFSATSVDQLPHHVAASLMFGHGLLLPVPDLDRTRLLVVFGANPLASNGSLMTAPGVIDRLAALRARGGRLVVVDPRRTETARVADEHLFIRPGTDALLLLALVREVLALGPNLGRLAAFTDGLEDLRLLAADFTPESVAGPTGVSPEAIRRLAASLRETGPAACYGRVGTSTQEFGGLCQWLINALNVVTGNLDRPGGAMFTRPAFDPIGGPRALGTRSAGFAKRRSRLRGLPSFSGEMPVATLAEEILAPGPGRYRALVTYAGNPVLSTPNGEQLDRALASLDFMVSIDPYLNETTRHASLVLPPASPLTRGHYDAIFNLLSVRNTARWSPPVLPKPEGARHDWEILLGLAEALAARRREGRTASRLLHAALRRLGPEGILDVGLRFGPYGSRWNVFGAGLTYRKVARAPHGLDLGPLEPCLPGRLGSPDRRIALAPNAFRDDLRRLRDAHAGTPPGARDGTLLLVGRRNVRDNNSWMHNLPRLMRGASRCTLFVHPDDAVPRGLRDGELADVSSRVGRIRVPVAVTEDVMRGVVCLPHGYGHGRGGVRLTVASKHAGASVNDLTDDQSVDRLTGNAVLNGVPVHVEAAAG